MKKRILSLALLFFVMHALPAVSAKLEMIEEAIESEALSIKMSQDLTGVIRGKVCQTCETILVRITPETRLYINRAQVDLSEALTRSGNPGTAFFNIKTRKVTKIHLYK